MAPTPPPQSLPVIRALWNFQDPKGTEAKFRDVLPAARASGDRAYLAELLSQIARTQGLQLRFEEADATLAEAESFLGEGMPRATVLCLLERGRVRNSNHRQAESKPYFLKAWDAARGAGLHGLAVDAAHMMAIASMPDGSLEWNLKAIAYAEEHDDPAARAWLGSLYNNTGWDHHNAGRYEEALALFSKNRAFEESKDPNSYDARVARWTVARALRSLGRTAESLAMQEALIAEFAADGHPDGYCFEEAGECLRTLGRKDDARPMFGKAWELLSKDPWLQRDEPKRLDRLKRLGDGAAE